MGVVHGVECFLSAMRESGEPGYIINTASMAGHVANVGMGAYTATKFAVVGYSEVLRQELRNSNIDVSVLCPAWVKTRIAESQRNFPGGQVHFEGQEGIDEISRVIAEEGISTEALAERVLEGMAARTFYLFTHPDFWPLLEKRLGRVSADYRAVIPG
jgi:short-subunit dehydrogenase